MAFLMRVILRLFLLLFLSLLIFWALWENVGGTTVIIFCKVLITNIMKGNILKERLTLGNVSHPINNRNNVLDFSWLHKHFILDLSFPPRQKSHYGHPAISVPVIIELKEKGTLFL